MLINGEHEAGEEADTVIMSYKKRPLDRVLPVGGGPWPDDERPPGRQVVILIDTSGSMHGASLDQAKESLLMALGSLQPSDRFNVIPMPASAAAGITCERPR